MPRLILGSLAAAVAMFLIAFVFYGTPLIGVGWRTAPPAVAMTIQAALKALPETGTYVVPAETSPTYAAGPVAQIAYNARGFPMVDPAALTGGFVQLAVSVFVLGCVLATAAVPFGVRARLVVGIAALAVVYLHLAGPVWYHTDWRNALYTSAADFIVLVAGGLIVARWFMPRGRAA